MKKFVTITILTISMSFYLSSAYAGSGHDHGHGKKAKGTSPEKAMGFLKKGNARYLAGEFRTSGLNQSDRTKVKDGQHPHTIIISCADSRVPPELLFDQKLGEIFVIRVAGEALDHSVLASAEYAVEHLGAQNIFVMGHTSCGAVKAALSTKEGESAGSEHLDALVADIRPRVKGTRGIASEPSPGVALESASNAEKIALEIPGRSKIMKEALEAKKIQIHWGLYHIDTGVVDFH